MVIPAYGIEKKLEAGTNVVEFTPAKSGTVGYSCWMGMIRSTITVVQDIGGSAAIDPGKQSAAAGRENCCAGTKD
jgi:plastocyanin domain-containing protein